MRGRSPAALAVRGPKRTFVKTRAGMIVVSAMLGTFTVILNNSSMNPAVPAFMEAFGTSASSASWIVTAFLLAMGMAMPLTGYLGDRFGKKRIYLLGMALFVAGSLLGFAAQGLPQALAARGLQGAAGGLMIPLSLPIMFDAYPKNERGRITGLWGIAAMAAPMIGPTLGGFLMEAAGWRWLFFANVPTGLIGLAVGLVYMKPEAGNPGRRFDGKGFAAVTLGAGLLLLALGRMTSSDALAKPDNLLLLGAGAALMAWFVRIELRSGQPLLNLRLFRIVPFTLSIVVATAQAVGMFATIFLIPLLVQNVYGYSAAMTGLVFLPSAVFSAGFVWLAGKRLDRSGSAGILTAGLLVTFASTLLLCTFGPHSPLWLLFSLMALRGAGLGLSNMPATTAGLNEVPDRFVAQGSAMNNLVRRMASSFGIVAISVFYELRVSELSASGSEYPAAGLQAVREGFLAIGALILLSVPAALLMNRGRRASAIPDLDRNRKGEER